MRMTTVNPTSIRSNKVIKEAKVYIIHSFSMMAPQHPKNEMMVIMTPTMMKMVAELIVMSPSRSK